MTLSVPHAEPAPERVAVPAGRVWRLMRRRLAGVALADAGLIALILLLVGVVSLPQLSAYARRTNEADARWVVSLLGARLVDVPTASDDLAALVDADPGLAHRLADRRRVDQRGDFLFHGYIYRKQGASLIAWPRRPGSSGAWSYAWRAGSGLWTRAASSERAPEERAAADSAPGWQRAPVERVPQ